MNQLVENQAFVAGLKYFLPEALLPIQAANPQYKFSIKFGPQSANFTHGYDFGVNPGSDFANNWFPRIVQFVRAFKPGHKVRIEGFSNIVVDPMHFFPLRPTYAAQSAPPPPPYDPTKPLPSPYSEPIYCIPCEGTIYTA